MGGEGVQIRLADGLREERSNSFSGSVDWSFPMGHWQSNILLEGFYTDLHHVFVLEDIGEDQNGDKIKERRNGSGAKVYGVNLDAKVAHGREAQLQLGFIRCSAADITGRKYGPVKEKKSRLRNACPVRRTTTVTSLLRRHH